VEAAQAFERRQFFAHDQAHFIKPCDLGRERPLALARGFELRRSLRAVLAR
jgi:hypothetical protein